jgi:hypothetical protein
VQKDNFKSFFTAAESWGNIEQVRKDNKQTNTISVAYGSLQLTTCSIELPGKASQITVQVNGREIPAKFTQEGNLVTIQIEDAVIASGKNIVLLASF